MAFTFSSLSLINKVISFVLIYGLKTLSLFFNSREIDETISCEKESKLLKINDARSAFYHFD
jgi:hypothetical protein